MFRQRFICVHVDHRGVKCLRTFGFEPTGRRGAAELWRNRASGACAAVLTEGGRFAEVTMVSAATC